MLERIRFRTKKDDMYPLTDEVKRIVEESGVEEGVCILFTTHTTASITITSFWDTLGHEDIQDETRRLIPTRVDFKHQHDTPEDAAGHVKSSLYGVSIPLIIHEGKLLLGHSQGIYFMEFDGPRNREVIVKTVSDK